MKAGNGTSRSISSNPNTLFNECLKQAATAERCAAEAMRNRERVRRALYRAAVAYQRLARDHHEWFIAQARSVGGIDALLESWFKPLAFFGEDWRDLLRDVAEGVTAGEYMTSTAGSFLRRQRVASLVRERADAPLPDVPDASLPPEKRVVLLEEQNQMLRQQLAASRKQAAELRRIAARQEQRIAELESVLNKVEKVTARRKAG